MGKSLAGKELGQGITQRKDGRYQARFTNRFGKRQTIYAKTLNEIRQRLRNEQYEDEKNLNIVSSDMTLDEWFDVWMDTCKKNCRNTTRANYTHSYKHLAWIVYPDLQTLSVPILPSRMRRQNLIWFLLLMR